MDLIEWQRKLMLLMLWVLAVIGSSIPEVEAGLKDTMNSVYEYAADFTCSFRTECCREPSVRRNSAVKRLRTALQKEFYGQHIAADVVVNALDAHLSDDDPKKPLVLSFHGWAGSGKTFLAELIVKALFNKGLKSKYVKMYSASYHFPDAEKVPVYWEKLQKEIKETLSACEYAVLVFDEVDVTPSGLFDSLVAFLENHSILGVNHRKAIYILLSNIGSNAITHTTMNAWKDGKQREGLDIHDFHDDISLESFNAKNTGLGRTRLIERVLIDYFIPFLPMERRHIIDCAKAEIQRWGAEVDPEVIADKLIYWPPDLKLFSQTGCKRVEQLVKYHVSEAKFKNEL